MLNIKYLKKLKAWSNRLCAAPCLIFDVPSLWPERRGFMPWTSCYSLSAASSGLRLCCVGEVINKRLEAFCVCALFNQLPVRFVCPFWVQVDSVACRWCSWACSPPTGTWTTWLLPQVFLSGSALPATCFNSGSLIYFIGQNTSQGVFWTLSVCESYLSPIWSELKRLQVESNVRVIKLCHWARRGQTCKQRKCFFKQYDIS